MTGFAGSRSLDERRRRRLATESEEAVLEAGSPPVAKRSAAINSPTRKRGPAHFPLRKLISPRLWKLAGVSLWGLMIAALILAGGWAAEEYTGRLGPGFVQFFDLQETHLVRCYVATAIFLASQLAMLICWLRSLSLRDFDGRYRGWAFCAVVGFVTALAIQTDAASAWSETVDWLWRAQFWNKSTLIWLVPAAVVGSGVFGFLHHEMRESRLALAMFWLASLLFAGLAVEQLTGPLPIPIRNALIIRCSVAMLGALLLFASLLFHCRHVIYISVEPPADRPSRLMAWLKRFKAWTFLRRPGQISVDAPSKPTTASKKRTGRKLTAAPKRTKAQSSAHTPVSSGSLPASPVAGNDIKKQLSEERKPLRRSA